MMLNIIFLGNIDFDKALKLQEELMEKRRSGLIENTLLLLEHPSVLTIGKRGNNSNIIIADEILKSQGVEKFEINRGGDVTYHGPGQIVGYPIFDLKSIKTGIKDFVWKIEDVFIRLLDKEFEIKASRDEKKYTGVWVGNEKITAVGLAVRHGITMHGFAFNVNTNLEHFKWIVPCGITDKGVTSLEKILGCTQEFEAINKKVAEYFCDVFEMEMEMKYIYDI